MTILRSTSSQHYIADLRAAYRGQRLYDPSYALAQDPDIWEKMLRDPHIRHQVDHRSRMVAGKSWRVVAGEEEDDAAQKLADVVRSAFEQIQKFTASRQGIAMDGIFLGSGYRYIESRRVRETLAKTPVMRWRLPTYLMHIGRSRFRFDPEWTDAGTNGEQNVRLVAKLWPLDYRNGGEAVELSKEDSQTIIRVAYSDDEARLGYGRGLMDSIYFAFYAKMKLVQEGLDSAEVWARGLPIAKIDATAHGGKDATNQDMATTFLRVMRKMAREYGVAIDNRDDIDIKWPAGSGWKIIKELIDYWDDKISSLCLSSKLPTGGGGDGAGSYARAETEEGSMEALVAGDRDVLDDSFSRHLIGWFCRQNHENIVTLGLDQAKKPKFVTGEEAGKDPEEALNRLRTAREMGMDVDTTEAYGLLDLTPPEDAPPVIKGEVGMPGFDLGSRFGNGAQGPPIAPDLATVPEGVGPEQGAVTAGGEVIAAEGVEPPNIQELSLAYERSIKNRDRATADVVRTKLWAALGEQGAPKISDAEWQEITSAGAPTTEDEGPLNPRTAADPAKPRDHE